MTTQELRHLFNTTFGLGIWPGTYEVDAETYANVCESLFAHKNVNFSLTPEEFEDFRVYSVEISFYIGRHGGPLFKGVELLLKK